MYIFSITFNFDSDYVVKKLNTYEEAVQTLQKYLTNEVKTVKEEQNLIPSVLNWEEDDVTLVYAEGYRKEDMNKEYALEDCAYYRIFEIKENPDEKYNRITSLLMNAVCAMRCGDYDGYTDEDIAKYLGCSVTELKELGVL